VARVDRVVNSGSNQALLSVALQCGADGVANRRFGGVDRRRRTPAALVMAAVLRGAAKAPAALAHGVQRVRDGPWAVGVAQLLRHAVKPLDLCLSRRRPS
jgi:hypothetical protein